LRLFTIDKTREKLIPYIERQFKESNRESDLEELLENNPEYFFEDGNILIIGRQVTTNLNSFIDILGIDEVGNTVAIELKRDKTPRDTIAQLLEYASFVENLDYAQLNEIYQNYSGEESSLEDYHQQYYSNELDEKVSFNKSTKLVVVAQKISKEIRQTALFLRKKGLDIYCVEFKYFQTKSGEKIITSDFVVGEDEFIRQKVQSASLPKTDEDKFLQSLDENGLHVFRRIFEFARQKGLMFRWGSKGFSLNVEFDIGFVGLFFGYPPQSVFKQSIYTGFEEIAKKVNNAEEIIDFYRNSLQGLDFFIKAKSNLKWVIEKPYSEKDIQAFLTIVDKVVPKIKENGLSLSQ
jgi:translation initiation factor 2 beta subunit (eIF-2beta)/eIF-5